MPNPFDISPMVSQIGASATGRSLILVERTQASMNDEGDSTYSEEEFLLSGVVFVLSADDDEVKAGVMITGDIQIFVPEDDAYVSKLKHRNKILLDGEGFQIKTVIREIGHYEVLAGRV